jgi:flagellar M-ring protein FliF
VELDFDQRQTDTQTFTPVVDDSGIIRSEQTVNESYNGTSNAPGGPAGTQSNVPGYVATENNSNAEYSKKETTKNYEINEAKAKTIASPGSIKRVNIAVLVNDDITPAQQESISRSVSSAVGINPDRGDTVSVEPLPFSTELADRRAAEEQAEKDRQARNMYIAIGLILLIIALIVGFYIRRKREKERLAREAAEEQARLEEEERQRQMEERAAAIESGEVEPEELTPEEQQHINERQFIEDLIRNKPAEVALLIKTWLSED